MRTRGALSTVTVLVIGMLFMSGCVSPSSTGTLPAAPAPSQIVNATVPVSPAPSTAPALPPGTISGTPEPHQIVNETVPGSPAPTPVPAGGTVKEPGYSTSASQNSNSTPPLFIENETLGGLFININRGGSINGLKIFIAREGTTVSAVEYTFLPDRTVREGENKGYLQVKIPPEGRSDLIKLRPGNYTAYLPDWNGGEPEQQSFMIHQEEITPIWFEGFSASGGGCGC